MFKNVFVISILIYYLIIIPDCQGHDKQFRFDYEFNELADGWLKYHIIPGTWREARMRCHAEGAVLASPLTNQLTEAVISFAIRIKGSTAPTAIFTGVHATFSKGDYTSIEGVPLSRLPITWAPGEPDNFENAESCLVMRTDGTVMDSRCEDVLPYVCYKKHTPLSMNECGTTDPEYELESRTGSCYKFHRQALVWYQAFMTCLAEGGHLAIINSNVEAKVILEIFAKNPHNTIIRPSVSGLVGTNSIGIGVHDWGEHMTFLTIHGETLDKAGYQVWSSGQPNNATSSRSMDEGQFCGSVSRDTRFNDIWCNVPIPFLCEKSPDSLLPVV